MALASIALHNICIDRGNTIPRNYDLTLDLANNKRRSREEIVEFLDMTDKSCNTFSLTSNIMVKKIRNVIKNKFWDEKQSADL